MAAAGPSLAVEMRAWQQGATPPLDLPDLHGAAWRLDQQRGKAVLVNFWATWCEPCIEEMPSLDKLGKRLGAAKLEVVGVNLGESESRIREFVGKTGVDFTILRDRDGQARKRWKVNGVPATFLIDARGKIRYSHVGVLDFSDPALEAQIQRMLPR